MALVGSGSKLSRQQVGGAEQVLPVVLAQASRTEFFDSERREMAAMESPLERLPGAVLQAIVSQLDMASICAVATSCRLLRACAGDVLPRLSTITLVDVEAEAMVVERLLAGNTELKSLTLKCSKLDDGIIKALTKPQLHTLCLSGCDHFSAKLLNEIAVKCPLLKILSLELGWHEDNSFSSIALEQLLIGCSQLESLRLRSDGCCFHTMAYASIPCLAASSLKALEIGYVKERKAKQILDVNADAKLQRNNGFSFSKLEKLSLVLDRITDSLLSLVAQRLSCLLELDLRDEPSEEPLAALDLTNTGVQQVGKCQLLRRLSLVRSQDCHPASFKRVSDLGIFLMAECCSNLESVRLGGFSRITDAGCRAVLHISSKLHTFELSNTPQLTDLAFHDLPLTPLVLECVSLASCILLSDYSVQHLALCKNLQSLNLKGCKSVGDGSMQAISCLSKLRVLALNGSDLSDHGLDVLGKGIAPLTLISLRGCHRVTDNGVAALLAGGLVNTLESMDLSGIAGLTDNATLAIVRAKMQNLEELRFRGCSSVGDTSVISLASAHSKDTGHGGTLRLLDLWNCRGVSAVSLKWFRKPYFPRLRWLGISSSLRQEILLSVIKVRPSVNILCDGTELGRMFSGEGDDVDDDYRGHDEEDELERWLDSDDGL
ncbi:unnamed protein product [Sphagnum troendelagicum]|uniref:F-box/LRR-repeat protein 15-like leucin rich repeat domain-containing protein n=1 Tax=Sphagnum troendelagicum TaxID=128251 RepID=A0ABP0U9M8_9BRYO